MKHLLLIPLLLLAFALPAQGVYQLPNPGFEDWDGSDIDDEPSHWNSFATSDGSFSGLASSPHHYHRHGGRPGTSGTSFLTLYTRSIMGIKANGNMTTGRIHAGAMQAASSDNYNYTQRSQSAFSQPFDGTPDSLYVWVSFYAASASSQAQISAILHGDSDFKAPNDEQNPALYCGRAKALVSRTSSSPSAHSWQQLRVPFVYDGSADARYLLLTLATNNNPGEGAADDSLSVDDIEFIYSAWLSGISVGGNPIATFEQGRFDYTVRVDSAALLDTLSVAAFPQTSDATVDLQRQRLTDTTIQVSLTVTAEDGVTVRHYSVLLTCSATAPTDPLAISAPSDGAFRLYPNPTSGLLRVEGSGLLLLSDLQGRLLMRRTLEGPAVIDLGALPAGTYLLRCGSAFRRVVKTNR